MSISRRSNGWITRREALGLIGATGLVGHATAASAASAADTRCVLIPRETGGPYPLFADTARLKALTRQNIAEGRGGTPLNLLLTVRNVNDGCTPIANALVYVWHCDKDGDYSGYRQRGSSTMGETFCRGVQSTDRNGQARFVTVYPGWYPGRITHIHFRVYLGDRLEATSQLGFPEDITRAVYDSPLYVARGQNRTVNGFEDDSVFADGVQHQLCSTARNTATGGYDASLNVGIAL
ncbi:MAG TPA: hypothetical protein VNQ81_08320 [Povalibacter sp.]|nr:hypothetical protein [Povalibacter sp.]